MMVRTMNRILWNPLWVIVLLCGGFVPSSFAETTPEPSATVAATQKTLFHVEAKDAFDGRAFEYRLEKAERLTDSVRFTLRLSSPIDTGNPQNDHFTVEYDLPLELGDALSNDQPYVKRPVVLVMHILNGDDALVEVMSQSLLRRGISTIRFKLPYYGERGDERGEMAILEQPARFAEILEQAMLDIRRVVDLVASRPEVDTDHLGITGVSLGALVSAAAVGSEPRLSRTMMILGGGDLSTIIGYSEETRELRKKLDALPLSQQDVIWTKIRQYDPLTQANILRPLAKSGRVFFITAEDDEVIPPVCAQKLADAMELPADQWITLPDQGHYTALKSLPSILDRLGDFFAEDLPTELRERKPLVVMTPKQVFFSMLRQLSTMMTMQPEAGRAFQISLTATVQMPDENATKNVKPSAKAAKSSVENSDPSAESDSIVDAVTDTNPTDTDQTKTEREYHGVFALTMGNGRRFRLRLNLPELQEASLECGQNAESLWLYSAKSRRLFIAELPKTEDGAYQTVDPLSTVDPDAWRTLQMGVGLAAGIGLAPDMLAKWVTLQEMELRGYPFLRIHAKELPIDAQLLLHPTTKQPEKLRLTAYGGSALVTIDKWSLDALEEPAQFDPPVINSPATTNVPTESFSGSAESAVAIDVQHVPVEDLVRSISAVVNFALVENLR